MPFLTQAFSPIISAIFNALSASASSVNDEEARLERQSLQRSYFSFIAAIVASSLLEVLASQESAVLQQVLVSLVQGAVEYPDPVVSCPADTHRLALSITFFARYPGTENLLLHPSSACRDMGW